MSFNIRMTVPVSYSQSPLTIAGTKRTYTCTSGSTIDVEEDDARLLAHAGWVRLSVAPDGYVGATSSRPSPAHINKPYIDTTLNAVVISDGLGNWLNAVTGAIV